MNNPDNNLLLPPNKRTYALAYSDTIQSDGGLKAEKPSTPAAVSMIIKPNHDNNLHHQQQQQHDQPDKSKRPRLLLDDDGLLLLLRQHINSNNMDFKDITDAKIIIDKKLNITDLKDTQARLSLPKNQIDPVVFLTRDEEDFLEKKVGLNNNNNNKNNHIVVKVIMGSSVYKMHLSRWNYASKSGNKGSWRYVLQHNWNKLKSDNKLQVDDIIRVVSFRSENRINFAILGPKRSFSLFGTRVEAFPWNN